MTTLRTKTDVSVTVHFTIDDARPMPVGPTTGVLFKPHSGWITFEWVQDATWAYYDGQYWGPVLLSNGESSGRKELRTPPYYAQEEWPVWFKDAVGSFVPTWRPE